MVHPGHSPTRKKDSGQWILNITPSSFVQDNPLSQDSKNLWINVYFLGFCGGGRMRIFHLVNCERSSWNWDSWSESEVAITSFVGLESTNLSTSNGMEAMRSRIKFARFGQF